MELLSYIQYMHQEGYTACAGYAGGFNAAAFKQESYSAALDPKQSQAASSKPKKKKRHRCEKCMLVVFDAPAILEPLGHAEWQTADKEAVTLELSSGLVWDSLFIQDLIWDVQSGPKCAAASVSSLALSFASAYGLSKYVVRLERWRFFFTFSFHRTTPKGDSLDQASVLRTYQSIGVPNIERTTAAVGNAQWRQAIALTAIADSRLRMVPRPLSAQFAAGADAADQLWDRVTREMKLGSRVMLHCNNHYVRVFGFRSGTQRGVTLKPVLKECHADLGGDSDGDEEDGAHDSDTTGGSWRALSATSPLVAALLGERAVHGAACEQGNGCQCTACPDLVLRREILTARKGQRAKHWVNWEQVVCDVQQHKIHCLLLVKPTGERGLTQAPPFINQEHGTDSS